jgi:hypothetical protein
MLRLTRLALQVEKRLAIQMERKSDKTTKLNFTYKRVMRDAPLFFMSFSLQRMINTFVA